MRLAGRLGLLAAGFMGGFMAAAAVAKHALPSRGDAESDDVSLVAVFDGVNLRSEAKAFRGGSMLAWLGRELAHRPAGSNQLQEASRTLDLRADIGAHVVERHQPSGHAGTVSPTGVCGSRRRVIGSPSGESVSIEGRAS